MNTDAKVTVEVDAADLLWVILEYGLLAAALEKDGMPKPPSMEAAFRLVDALPEDIDIDLPAEAQGSLVLATLVGEGLLG